MRDGELKVFKMTYHTHTHILYFLIPYNAYGCHSQYSSGCNVRAQVGKDLKPIAIA